MTKQDPTPSAFAAALASQGANPGPKCSIAKVREELDPHSMADLEAALASPIVTAAAIVRGLKALGFQVRAQTVLRHRKRECACP